MQTENLIVLLWSHLAEMSVFMLQYEFKTKMIRSIPRSSGFLIII